MAKYFKDGYEERQTLMEVSRFGLVDKELEKS